MPKFTPKISVIIPCKNEVRDIKACIKSINDQTFSKKNYEIIVIDGGSTDGTLEFLDKQNHVRVFQEFGEHRSPANARNMGANMAKGKILVFMDADVMFNNIYLETIYEHFKDKSVSAVTTKTQDVKNSTFLAKCYYAERCASMPKRLAGVQCVRNDIFENLGGFNPKLGVCEDVELWQRFVKSNYKATYEPKAIMFHKEPSTFEELWRESKWWGHTYAVLLREKPGIAAKPITGIIYRTATPFVVAAALFSGNFWLLMLSGFCIAENAYRMLKAAILSKYALPSLLLPIFKTMRYYSLLAGIFTK